MSMLGSKASRYFSAHLRWVMLVPGQTPPKRRAATLLDVRRWWDQGICGNCKKQQQQLKLLEAQHSSKRTFV